jgi:hypothetical protein
MTIPTIHDLSPDVALPPVEDVLLERPKRWQGMTVDWSTDDRVMPVHVRHFNVLVRHESLDLHVLAARYDLEEALVGGTSLGTGYFLEYLVGERTSRAWTVHRLLQRTSVTYSDREEQDDYVRAAEIRDPAILSLDRPPRWKVDEAVWPTVDGGPMIFVGQAELPDTSLTRRLLTWDVNTYLFASRGDEARFKIVEQSLDAQTAEEHYRDEDA